MRQGDKRNVAEHRDRVAEQCLRARAEVAALRGQLREQPERQADAADVTEAAAQLEALSERPLRPLRVALERRQPPDRRERLRDAGLVACGGQARERLAQRARRRVPRRRTGARRSRGCSARSRPPREARPVGT